MSNESETGEGGHSLPLLVSAINAAWCDRYAGPPVSDASQLVTRVEKLAEDRDCWLANARANQAEYIKLEKQVKTLKADNQRLRLGISAHVRASDPSPLIQELSEYISR